jgi:hypothetical protein
MDGFLVMELLTTLLFSLTGLDPAGLVGKVIFALFISFEAPRKL